MAAGHDVICSVKHPMNTDPEYSKWYITTMSFYVNDVVAAELKLGPNVSRDPIIGIHLSELKNWDTVQVKWVDTRANRGSALVIVQ